MKSMAHNLEGYLEKPFPTLVGYWNLKLVNEQANEAYALFFGKRPDEVVGRHISEVLGEELYHMNYSYFEKAFAGEFQSFERILSIPGGGRKHTLTQYIPSHKDGKVQGFFAVVTDLTHLKLLQEEILAEKNQVEDEKRRFDTFAQALNQLAAVAILDHTGHVSYVNDKFAEKYRGQ